MTETTNPGPDVLLEIAQSNVEMLIKEYQRRGHRSIDSTRIPDKEIKSLIDGLRDTDLTGWEQEQIDEILSQETLQTSNETKVIPLPLFLVRSLLDLSRRIHQEKQDIILKALAKAHESLLESADHNDRLGLVNVSLPSVYTIVTQLAKYDQTSEAARFISWVNDSAGSNHSYMTMTASDAIRLVELSKGAIHNARRGVIRNDGSPDAMHRRSGVISNTETP